MKILSALDLLITVHFTWVSQTRAYPPVEGPQGGLFKSRMLAPQQELQLSAIVWQLCGLGTFPNFSESS